MKITTTEALLILYSMESGAFKQASESLPEASESLKSKLEGLAPYAPYRSIRDWANARYGGI